MAELRKDPLSGRWVAIAENRAQRPDELRPTAARRIVAPCPFCAGHENETPPAVASYPLPSSSISQSWQVRVVPNKYQPSVRNQHRAETATNCSRGRARWAPTR